MGRPTLRFVPAACVVAACTAVIAWWTMGFRAFTTDGHALLAAGSLPRPAPSITLAEPSGTITATDQLRGRYVLLTFMYLGCTDVCRIVEAQLHVALAALDELVPERLVLVSLSFDPKTDSDEALAAHWERHARPRGWIMGRLADTLGESQLKDLARLGVWVYRRPDGGYNHAAFTFLIDPNGWVIDVFPPDTPAADIVRAVRDAVG